MNSPPDLPLSRLDDLAFWRERCPAMTLTEEGGAVTLPAYDVPAAALEQALGFLRGDGYFVLASVLPVAEVEALRDAVERVAEATGFPVFALVYDDFWRALVRLSAVASAA